MLSVLSSAISVELSEMCFGREFQTRDREIRKMRVLPSLFFLLVNLNLLPPEPLEGQFSQPTEGSPSAASLALHAFWLLISSLPLHAYSSGAPI